MKKFKYKLENILQLKERMYEQISMELKEASAKRMYEEEVLNSIAARLNAENKSFSKTTGRKLSSEDLNFKSEKISYLKELLLEQRQIVDELVIKEEEVKLRLIEAYKDKKVHEKLKEKKFEIYLEEEKIAEQNLLDESVTNRYKAVNE